MAIDGVTSAPFSSRTVMPLAKKSMLNESIIENSRAKYSMARAEIEQQIKEKTEGMVPPQNLISQISFSGDSVNMTPSNVDQAKTEDVLKINPKEEKACMPVSEMKQDGEQRQLKDDQVSDLPAELANAKQAEDLRAKLKISVENRTDRKISIVSYPFDGISLLSGRKSAKKDLANILAGIYSVKIEYLDNYGNKVSKEVLKHLVEGDKVMSINQKDIDIKPTPKVRDYSRNRQSSRTSRTYYSVSY